MLNLSKTANFQKFDVNSIKLIQNLNVRMKCKLSFKMNLKKKKKLSFNEQKF